MPHALHRLQIDPIIRRALEEDWGYGDWTTDLCVPASTQAAARLIAREPTVVAGLEIARAVFQCVDEDVHVEEKVTAGELAPADATLLTVTGAARSILKAERVALNFLGRMCGVAALTRQFVDQLDGTATQLLDTRKTVPGLRLFDKLATGVGGARNHRFGLCDGVIVKENHIRAAGGIRPAVERLLESLAPTIKIEVECTNLDEVQEALDAGADIIMLDNMGVSEIAMAVRSVRGRAQLEASGGITLDNVRAVAETGVNFISTSAVLHSSRWADLSLLFDGD